MSGDEANRWSADAERAVLGTIIKVPDMLGNVEGLRPTDFFEPTHEQLFELLIVMSDEGTPITTASVIHEADKIGLLPRLGGAGAVHALAREAQVAAFGYFVAEIIELRMWRNLAAFHSAGLAKVRARDGVELSAALSASQSELDAIADVAVKQSMVSAGDSLFEVLDEIEALGQVDGATTGIPTGFVDLDEKINGLHPGQMIIVAARPAVGKSTLGLDFARSSAIKHGEPTAIFSLEMSRSEIMMRMLSAECRIELGDIRRGNLDTDQWQRISRKVPVLQSAPLYIDDTPNTTVNEIKAKARRLKQRHGLKLIIIDYLQLMDPNRKTDNRQAEVSEMSRSIKLLAKELDVPVVIMSQLNRNSENRTNKLPQVSDLRESGSLEQDADVILLLFREEVADPDSLRVGEADIIIGKQRNGPTGTVTVSFQGHLSRFVNMGRSEPPM